MKIVKIKSPQRCKQLNEARDGKDPRVDNQGALTSSVRWQYNATSIKLGFNYDNLADERRPCWFSGFESDISELSKKSFLVEITSWKLMWALVTSLELVILIMLIWYEHSISYSHVWRQWDETFLSSYHVFLCWSLMYLLLHAKCVSKIIFISKSFFLLHVKQTSKNQLELGGSDYIYPVIQITPHII